jgi:hypothetical protein
MQAVAAVRVAVVGNPNNADKCRCDLQRSGNFRVRGYTHRDCIHTFA